MMKDNIGSLIRTARLNRGMLQKDIGLSLGYPETSAQMTVARWEAGTRPVPMDKIKPLAELLGINPVELLP
jgi:transcriptional regulator with XRE-family HTH domain